MQMLTVPGLRVIEDRHPEIRAVRNRDIEARAGIELAPHFQAPPTLGPGTDSRDVAAIALEGTAEDDARHDRADRVQRVQLRRVRQHEAHRQPPFALVAGLGIEIDAAETSEHGGVLWQEARDQRAVEILPVLQEAA